VSEGCEKVYDLTSETPMKDKLKYSANRHARSLIKKLSSVMDLPEIAFDSIHKELEYGTMDGYRITMRHIKSEKETENDDDEDRFNR
jgi:hypothetical protein